MPATKEGRVTKLQSRKSSSRRVQNTELPLVERTNALPIDQFISLYVTPSKSTSITNEQTSSTSDTINKSPTPTPISTPAPTKQNATPLAVYSAATIPPPDLEACLDVIEQTSGDAYAASGIGWSRPKKRKEMLLPDMKYLLVRGGLSADNFKPGSGPGSASISDEPEVKDDERESKSKSDSQDKGLDSRILGFLSFMVTYEDGKEVVYCYEIHLSALARGKGLGGLLMSRMEEIGRSVGLEKAMLTVFKSNRAARDFYKKGGYEVDENSPQPRTLRNGTVKEYDYEILSKRLK